MRSYIAFRDTGLVQIFVPFYFDGNGVEASSYELQYASNWDGVFAPLLSSLTKVGYISKSARLKQYKLVSNTGANRGGFSITFDPSDLGLSDTDLLFFKLIPTVSGAPVPDQEIFIVLPTPLWTAQTPVIVLDGNAAAATKLRLPWLIHTVSITSASTGDVSFSFGGAPITVTPTSPFQGAYTLTGELELTGELVLTITLGKSKPI